MTPSNASVNVLFFLLSALTLGILLSQLLSRFRSPLPYTIVIFISGILLSVFAQADNTADYGYSITQWSDIDAELILFVFLPPLVFGESIYLNWFHVVGGAIQSVVLAGPGVVIGTFLMGGCMKACVPEWDINLCMLFGAIVSATDPVAVVSLLKGSNASPKMTILIVGESLLNDGTAMIMFTLFFNIIYGTSYSAVGIFLFFLNSIFGSVFFGIICGLLTVRWMRTSNRRYKEFDSLIQIMITITSSYSIFFIAQYFFYQSGVLACCSAGVTISCLAPPFILKPESMHSVWALIEWLGNTLIFLLAGLIFGSRTLGQVTAIDWVFVFLLYLIINFVRIFIILIFYPVLSRVDHKCSASEAIFMSWTGLRGALCMALALIVESTAVQTDYIGATDGSRLFFYVGGIATLTLVINGTFSQYVMKYLDLIPDEESYTAQIIQLQIKRNLVNSISKLIKRMEFSRDDEENIKQVCSLFNTSSISKSGAKSASVQSPFHGQNDLANTNTGAISAVFRQKNEVNGATKLTQLISQRRTSDTELIPELLQYYRTSFLETVRAYYYHEIETEKVPRNSFTAGALLYSIDMAVESLNSMITIHSNALYRSHSSSNASDVVSIGLRDWKCIENEIDKPSFLLQIMRFLVSLFGLTTFRDWLKKLERRRDKRAVFMLTSFIEGHEHAQTKLHEYAGLSVELEGDENNNSIAAPEEVQVKNESAASVLKARSKLDLIDADVVSTVRFRQMARMVLVREGQLVEDMISNGLVKHQNAEEFYQQIDRDKEKLSKVKVSLTTSEIVMPRENRSSFKGWELSADLSEPML